MEWFDRLFRRKPNNTKLATSLNGWLPIYGQFGTNIYASDVVVQALKCIVDEMKKLQPMHIRYINNDPVPVRGNIQEVLDDCINKKNHFRSYYYRLCENKQKYYRKTF